MIMIGSMEISFPEMTFQIKLRLKFPLGERERLTKSIDRGHPVQKYNKEEVEIGESVELFKQVSRQERENCIFCSSNAIVQVLAVRLIPGLKIKCYNWFSLH